MTRIQRFETSARMSHAVVHGDTVYLAGAIAADLDGGIAAQATEALAEIERVLALAGSDKSRLLTAQIWLKDLPRDFAAMNAVWEAWVPAGQAPARATCQAEMADPRVLVEFIVTAAVD
ncbi:MULTISPECIES: RidA family protein [Cupriavidus]